MTFEKVLKKTWIDLKKTNEKSLSKFDGELDISSVTKSINRTLKIIDSRKKELNKEFRQEYLFEEKLVGLYILQHTYMFNLLDEYFGLNSDNKNWKEEYHSIRIATIILHQMNNSLVAFFKLLGDGFSFQANLIFRNILEQGSTILAILFDEEFVKRYKENPEIKDEKMKLKHWRQYLSPKQIDLILMKAYSEHDELLFFKEASFFQYKNSIYSDTSEFVHSQFLASLMSSYSSKKENDEIIDMNLFGRIDSNIDRVLFNFFPYLDIFFHNIITALNHKHNFKFEEIDNVEALKIWAMHNLRNKIYIEYLTSKYCS